MSVSVDYLRNLRSAGHDPFSRGPSNSSVITDTSQYVSEGDTQSAWQKALGGVFAALNVAGGAAYSGVRNTAEAFGLAEDDGRDFGETYKDALKGEGFSDWMYDAWDIDDTDSWWKRAAVSTAGFAADVALDPTTYLTFGTSVLGKKALAEVAQAGSKKVVRNLAKEAQGRRVMAGLANERFQKETGRDIFEEALQKEADRDWIVKQVNDDLAKAAEEKGVDLIEFASYDEWVETYAGRSIENTLGNARLVGTGGTVVQTMNHVMRRHGGSEALTRAALADADRELLGGMRWAGIDLSRGPNRGGLKSLNGGHEGLNRMANSLNNRRLRLRAIAASPMAKLRGKSGPVYKRIIQGLEDVSKKQGGDLAKAMSEVDQVAVDWMRTMRVFDGANGARVQFIRTLNDIVGASQARLDEAKDAARKAGLEDDLIVEVMRRANARSFMVDLQEGRSKEQLAAMTQVWKAYDNFKLKAKPVLAEAGIPPEAWRDDWENRVLTAEALEWMRGRGKRIGQSDATKGRVAFEKKDELSSDLDDILEEILGDADDLLPQQKGKEWLSVEEANQAMRDNYDLPFDDFFVTNPEEAMSAVFMRTASVVGNQRALNHLVSEGVLRVNPAIGARRFAQRRQQILDAIEEFAVRTYLPLTDEVIDIILRQSDLIGDEVGQEPLEVVKAVVDGWFGGAGRNGRGPNFGPDKAARASAADLRRALAGDDNDLIFRDADEVAFSKGRIGEVDDKGKPLDWDVDADFEALAERTVDNPETGAFGVVRTPDGKPSMEYIDWGAVREGWIVAGRDDAVIAPLAVESWVRSIAEVYEEAWARITGDIANDVDGVRLFRENGELWLDKAQGTLNPSTFNAKAIAETLLRAAPPDMREQIADIVMASGDEASDSLLGLVKRIEVRVKNSIDQSSGENLVMRSMLEQDRLPSFTEVDAQIGRQRNNPALERIAQFRADIAELKEWATRNQENLELLGRGYKPVDFVASEAVGLPRGLSGLDEASWYAGDAPLEAIRNMYAVRNPEDASGFTNYHDALLTIFKTYATVGRIGFGFHVRNFFGAMSNNVAAGVRKAQVEDGFRLGKVWNAVYRELDTELANVSSVDSYYRILETRVDNLWDEMYGLDTWEYGKHGLTSPGQAVVDAHKKNIFQSRARDAVEEKAIRSYAKTDGKVDYDAIIIHDAQQRYLANPTEENLRAWKRVKDGGITKGEQYKVQASYSKATQNRYVQWSADIGQNVEQWVRMAAYLHGVKRFDAVEAGSTFARTLHFDYADLSDFERLKAKRVLPFYVWMRNNVALQLRLMANRPGAFQNFADLQEAVALAFGDPSVDQSLVPEWARGKGGILGYASALTPGGRLIMRMESPKLDLLELFNGDSPASGLMGMAEGMSPIVKGAANASVMAGGPGFDLGYNAKPWYEYESNTEAALAAWNNIGKGIVPPALLVEQGVNVAASLGDGELGDSSKGWASLLSTAIGAPVTGISDERLEKAAYYEERERARIFEDRYGVGPQHRAAKQMALSEGKAEYLIDLAVAQTPEDREAIRVQSLKRRYGLVD